MKLFIALCLTCVYLVIIYRVVNKCVRIDIQFKDRQSLAFVKRALLDIAKSNCIEYDVANIYAKLTIYKLFNAISAVNKKIDNDTSVTDVEKVIVSIDKDTLGNLFSVASCVEGYMHKRRNKNAVLNVIEFSQRLVLWTQCGLGGSELYDIVNEYAKITGLTIEDIDFLYDLLLVLSVSLLIHCYQLDTVIINDYLRGVSDCKNESIDIDNLNNYNYISGFMLNHNSAIKTFFDVNNICIDECVLKNKCYRAEIYERVISIINFIHTVLCNKSLNNNPFVKENMPQKFVSRVGISVSFFVFSICSLFLAIFWDYSIFSCVFCGVLVLLSIVYFFKNSIEGVFVKKFLNSFVCRSFVQVNYCQYVGGEVYRIYNKVSGKSSAILADNRGNLTLCKKGKTVYKLELYSKTEDRKISFCEYDAVVQSFRMVFRFVNDACECFIEIFPSLRYDAFLIELSLINRRNERISVEQNLKFVNDGNVSGCFDNNVLDIFNYGDASSEVYNMKNTAMCLYAKYLFNIAPFSVSRERIIVVTGENSKNVANQLRGCYFLCERVALSAFCYNEKVPNNDKLAFDDGTQFRGAVKTPNKYERVDCSKYANKVLDKNMNVFACDGNNYNIFSNEKYGAKIFSDGKSVGYFYDNDTFNGKVFAIKDYMVRLGENGFVWQINDFVAFGNGVCEFVSGANGCITSLKRFVGNSFCGEFFVVSIENKVNKERNINVMISVSADECMLKDSKMLCSHIDSDKTLFLSSSRKINDYCTFEEGYFRRGIIDRTSNFNKGGENGVVALSVNLNIPAMGKRKVAFKLSVNANKDKAITILDAEKEYVDMQNFYDRRCSFILKSTDSTLNNNHLYSLNKAIFAFNIDKRIGNIYEALIECLTVKYANLHSVKNFIRALCKQQDSNGKLRVKNESLVCQFLFPLVAKNIMSFCNDDTFCDDGEKSLYSLDNNCYKSKLIERCLLSLEFGVNELLSIDEYQNDKLLNWLVCECIYAMLPCECNKLKRQKYIAIISCLRRSVDCFKRKLIYDDSSSLTYGNTVRAFACFSFCCYDIGYQLLNEYKNSIYECEYSQSLPSSNGGANASLFFCGITENILGVNIAGDNIKIDPHITDGMAKFSFSVSNGNNTMVNIDIDNVEKRGSWLVKDGKISYLTNSISINGNYDKWLTVRRSGIK